MKSASSDQWDRGGVGGVIADISSNIFGRREFRVTGG